MLEIGNTLEHAREQRGLELADVERETNLRERYLRALEQEQFDLLPPGGYRRTFLRGYATFLGLDAGVIVDEYVSRYEQSAQVERPPIHHRPVRRRRRVPPSTAVATVAALAVIGVAIWQLSGGDGNHPARTPPPTLAAKQPTAPPVTHRTVTHHVVTHAKTKPKPVLAKVVFSAATGDCWLEIHTGTEQGKTLYEGVLQEGQTLKEQGKLFWVRMGAPGSLTVTVNGKPQSLPSLTSNVTIDVHGLHAA